MAWIVSILPPFRQQKTEIRATRINGLKNGLKSPGCTWIPAAFGRQRKAKNKIFSTTYIHLWKTLKQRLDFTADGALIEAWASMKRFVPRMAAASSRRMGGRTRAWISRARSANKAYDTKDFVQSLREQEVTPHVAAKRIGSAINGRTTRHAGYAVSLKKRKRVEEIFGWSKAIGGSRKTCFIGLAKVSSQTIFTFACYNLRRMATLLGWRLSST